jgi:hypothetical protein
MPKTKIKKFSPRQFWGGRQNLIIDLPNHTANTQVNKDKKCRDCFSYVKCKEDTRTDISLNRQKYCMGRNWKKA